MFNYVVLEFKFSKCTPIPGPNIEITALTRFNQLFKSGLPTFNNIKILSE